MSRGLGQIEAIAVQRICMPADPSGREQTDSTSPDPEEHEASTNPVDLLGVEGQEQAAHAFCRHKKEDPGMDCGDGEESWNKEPRRVTGGDQDVLKTDEQQKELRGAGGALRKFRPRLKESVASTVPRGERGKTKRE
ncbi:hypothetical protein NDU88_002703 [Pleurodeles waltl]|uniref:Uncharacterized protein n=1 Tax=Pleurodeles waltl TaxID=8319 RepID=A0AAV7W354_PLEWA|nr:hypothetical protein NDU88_002703 [Pleurodeles waltl]